MLKYLALLCYTTIFSKAEEAGCSNSYNESLAYYLVDFAGIAYCCGNRHHACEEWSCETCKKHPQVSYHRVFRSTVLKFTDTVGFLAYDNSTQKLILSVRGTDPFNIINWLEDIDVLKTSWGVPDCHRCKVHKGLLRAYDTVKAEIMALFVDAYVWVTTPITGIYITGHSTGAAIATLAAVDLLDAGYAIESVYTYGCPRFGNPGTATYISKKFPSNHYRITHRLDPTPHVPPRVPRIVFNYYHTTREVWYPQTPTGYFFVCDNSGEDPECSDSVALELRHELDDHLDYMGFPFSLTILQCKL